MHPVLLRSLNTSVYLFAIGITIWSLLSPYMKTNINGISSFGIISDITIDHYLDKFCLNNICINNSDSNATDNPQIHAETALYALYIIFIILAGVYFTLFISNKYTKINTYIGIVLLALSFAIMFTLIIVIKTASINLVNKKYNYTFTSASILMIIACCFIIINQAFANSTIRSIHQKIRIAMLVNS
jgi:hypothetical protein